MPSSSELVPDAALLKEMAHANHAENVLEAFSSMQDSMSFVSKYVSSEDFRTSDAAACQAAVVATYNEFQTGSCAPLRTLFDRDWDTTTGADIAPQVTAHCESQCATDLVAHFNAIRTGCSDVSAWDPQWRQMMRNVSRLNRIVCSKVDGAYCFPKFFDFIRDLAARGDALSADPSTFPFEALCTRCNIRLFRMLMTFADYQAGHHIGLRVMCMRAWNGEYCVREAHAIGLLFDNGNDVEGGFKRLCRTRCFQRIIRLYLRSPHVRFETPAKRTELENFQKLFVCTRHSSGELCIVRIIRLIGDDTGPHPCDNGPETNTCPEACKEAIRDLDLGCCANSLFRIMNIAGDTPNQGDDLRAWYVGTCGNTQPIACARRRAIATLVYLNFRRTWVEATAARKQAILDAITKDLQQGSGAAGTDVTCSAISWTGPAGQEAMAVSCQITTDNGGISQILVAQFKSGSFPTTNVNDPTRVDPTAFVDPTSSSSIDPVASTASGDERTEEDESSSGLSTGAKAGIALGVLALVALVAAVVAVVVIKKKKAKNTAYTAESGAVTDADL